MYSVFCDRNLLHSDTIDERKLISPKLELELNKAGKFEFSIYPNHKFYPNINKLKSTITIYDDNDIIFKGRVLNSERGWYNQQKITCEGELAFLNDSMIEPFDYLGDKSVGIEVFLNWLLRRHNEQVGDDRQLFLGDVILADEDENSISIGTEDYDSAWNILSDFLESAGGYIVVRHDNDTSYIDYFKDINVIASQNIEYGLNLTDVTQIAKGEDIYTALIPLGKKPEDSDNRITISSVNDGKNYLVNEEQANRYGRIFRTMVWDNVTDPADLLNKATEIVSSIGKLTQSIEVNAVDISPLNDDVNSFKIGRKVRVTSSPHGINDNFLIEKLSIDLMKPESNKLTLNKTFTSFTEQSSSTSHTVSNLIKEVANAKETVANVEIDITSKLASDIEISAESILQSISEEYYAKGDIDTLLSDTRTEFEQTADSFDFRFSQYDADLQDIVAGNDAEFELIRKYIRFVDGNIVLGEEGNLLTLKIQNDRISFLENDVEVAYFSNKKLYVMDGTFINSLSIGNFGFFPRANGNLSLKKVGE